MPDIDYEAAYLALCQRFEGLWRECPCLNPLAGIVRCDPCVSLSWSVKNRRHAQDCLGCEGKGWLPRPAPERLGALVKLGIQAGLEMDFVARGENGRVQVFVADDTGDHGFRALEVRAADEPWQALTAALTAALAEEPA